MPHEKKNVIGKKTLIPCFSMIKIPTVAYSFCNVSAQG